MKYKAIAFDLDDTLLNTSGILVPQAAQKACLSLISVGAQCSLEECLIMRTELSKKLSHPEIFGRIADEYDCPERELGLQLAILDFYNPEVPERLPLIEGALKNLEYLNPKYDLYLVTMGIREAQEKKIAALQIGSYFKKIFILDSLRGERKQNAFEAILQHSQCQPSELLSIGNRLSAEIRDAKLIGADTCYFPFGEHVGETPTTAADYPDFTITTHSDLIKTCHL